MGTFSTPIYSSDLLVLMWCCGVASSEISGSNARRPSLSALSRLLGRTSSPFSFLFFLPFHLVPTISCVSRQPRHFDAGWIGDVRQGRPILQSRHRHAGILYTPTQGTIGHGCITFRHKVLENTMGRNVEGRASSGPCSERNTELPRVWNPSRNSQ